ncbi:hypothetical protein AAEU32_15605 [Pseudoalteromonas sp. SSDWG2]|uniref:hypothetical protein n=1 Tax=Pseudoalteromonas sp. SSDWG2 TaxID=3139391 RepID=UPI003BA96819
MPESNLITQLGQRKQQQSDLVKTVHEHYADYVFDSAGSVPTSESVYFPLKNGVLEGYWLDTDAGDYANLVGKALSSIDDLYFFVFTPEQMQELVFNADDDEEE